MSSDDPGSRKTRAIMFSDIKGYSKLMGQNETLAMALLEEHNALVVPRVQKHGGQVLKFIGDAVLASYESAADAVLAAIEVQQALAQRNASAKPEAQIVVRIGIHVGDVLLKGDDVFGDGVNIAARLEPQAEPGGIAISQTVNDMVRALPQIRTQPMGVRELKNIGQPMQLYRVCFEGAPPAVTPAAPPTVDRGAQRIEQALTSPLPAFGAPIDESNLSRRERKRLRKMREAQLASPVEGWVWAAGAAALVGFAALNPHMWWLIFVALGPAKRAARILGRPKVQAALPTSLPAVALPVPAPAAASEPDVSEKAKVDALCDRLAADLAGGPAVAREVIKNPEKTVQALRKSCHELLRRTAQLRALGGPAELHRLEGERSALTARTEAEPDAVARERLSAAVASLEEQVRQRQAMAQMASRVDAEYTRLYYALQNLHTQVLRMRSVDLAAEPQQGVRETAERLAAEMDAVAQALEELSRPEPAAVSPVAGAEALPTREPVRVR